MPEQEVTIKVDIPDGYEATGEYRIPDVFNDYWIDPIGQVFSPGGCVGVVGCHRIILRKKWQWPEWLRLPYIAMAIDGRWYGFSEKPTLQLQSGCWDCHRYVYLLSPEYFDFTPPECTDWKQSLRKNPNAK